MKNKLGLETILGGIFGIIAIIAIIVEIAMSGFTNEVIWGGIKDISDTLVAVMVFFVAIKNIPRKSKLSFEEKLEKALANWQEENRTMIVKSIDDDKTHLYGFSMCTNINNFYNAEQISTNVGWFVRMPLIKSENYNKENIEIKFHLNKGTFFEGMLLDNEQTKQGLEKLSLKFASFITGKSNGFANATSKLDTIIVTIKQPIVTDEDIAQLISLINSMYQAYLASANIKL